MWLPYFLRNILLFSKNAFSSLKLTVKQCIVQEIYISNKCSYFKDHVTPKKTGVKMLKIQLWHHRN